jgi:hypothetical protein
VLLLLVVVDEEQNTAEMDSSLTIPTTGDGQEVGNLTGAYNVPVELQDILGGEVRKTFWVRPYVLLFALV